MKFQCVALLLAVCPALSSASLRRREDPAKTKLDMEFAAKDSFGDTKLTPPCSTVQCGEYSCPAPFELKMDNTCCGYCWAPDHAVAIDRHVAIPYNSSGMVVEQCDSAPSTCKGPGTNVVRCFKPTCRVGDAPHCGAGACCAMCKGR